MNEEERKAVDLFPLPIPNFVTNSDEASTFAGSVNIPITNVID